MTVGRPPFDWVDAFTDTAFGGNGCVVVHEAADLSIETRTALVRETSLAECAYVVPSANADFGARYYLADREIPMAGHPTVATAASLLSRGMVRQGETFTLEVGAGVMSVEIGGTEERPVFTMTQAAPAFGETVDARRIARLYGLDFSDIVGEPRIVSTGTPFCITVLKDHGALRRAALDVDDLRRWRAETNEGRADLMEPFLVTLEGMDGGDTFSRLLLAPPCPPEDPFTGSATGCMGCYLWHHGLIDSPSFVATQGHWMGRPGRGRVDVMGPRDAIEGVRVGGPAVVLMSGHLNL